MKTKIISVLLCVCMLAGVMTIAGMALDKTIPNEAKVDLKQPLEIDVGTSEDSIQSGIGSYMVISNSSVSWNDIKTYYEVKTEITEQGTKEYVEVKLTEKLTPNQPSDFLILTLTTKHGDVLSEGSSTEPRILFLREEIVWVTKLYDLQMGVRKYGENGQNLVASNIATVTYNVLKHDPMPNDPDHYIDGITGVTDKLYDLKYGTKVTLKAELKKEYEKFYDFYCWVDGSGNVKWEETTTTVTITSSAAMFAVYKEITDRFVVTYKSNEGGKIIFNDSNNLKIFEGDGQVSVFEGSSPQFTFVPDEGYEVSKVIVNEDGTPKEVSSIKTLFSSLFDAADFNDALAIFGTFADATNKDVYTYTFKKIATNASIQVVFIKSKVYEPASGVEYVPGPELSTGTDDEADADGDGAQATVIPNEDGSPADVDVANPQTGSATAIAAFATLTVAAAAAFVTAKKKRS